MQWLCKEEEWVRRKNGQQGKKSKHMKELDYCDPLWRWLTGSDSNTRLEKLGFILTFPNLIANSKRHPVDSP